MEKISKYDPGIIQKRADLMGGLSLIILTVLSFKGLKLYVESPENHKLVFSLSVLWLINASIHLLTYKKFRMGDPYKARFRKWEKEGKIYLWFGLKIFRKILFFSPFVLMSLGMRIRAGKSDLERVLREINMAEGTHKISLLVTGIVCVILLLAGYIKESLYLFAGLILFHGYPVMLQRWNRGRIVRLLKNEKNTATLNH